MANFFHLRAEAWRETLDSAVSLFSPQASVWMRSRSGKAFTRLVTASIVLPGVSTALSVLSQ